MKTSLGHDANEQRAQIILLGLSVTADGKILVDASDTLSGYLADKLKAGSNIQLVIENVGGNERLRVDVSSSVATKAYADSGDVTTLASANAHSDSGDTTTLVAAKAYTDAHSLPPSTLGAVLIHNGTSFVPVQYGSTTLSSDSNQAPAIASGQIFFTDDTGLTQNRSITPDPTGVDDTQGMTIIVKNVSGSFHYQLVADQTIMLTRKEIIELTMISGVWTIVQRKTYTGSL